mgnify:CR=1 FL=1
MADFKYTNATTGTTFNPSTGRFLDTDLDYIQRDINALKDNVGGTFENVSVKVPNGSEKSYRFLDAKGNLKAYLFYHAGVNKVGFYDAQMPRAIWRTELGSMYLDIVKHLRPEMAGLDLGTSALKWSKLYATTGTIQTSDEKEKEAIKPISSDTSMAKSNAEIKPTDFVDFVKNTNFVTYEWKNKDIPAKGLETQIGFLAQEVSKDKVGSLIATESEFSMTNLVMSLGVALQEALKKIEELESKIENK